MEKSVSSIPATMDAVSAVIMFAKIAAFGRRLRTAERPFTWSMWLCVTTTAPMRPMSTPARRHRQASSRPLIPQSTRRAEPPDSTKYALPPLPLARETTFIPSRPWRRGQRPTALLTFSIVGAAAARAFLAPSARMSSSLAGSRASSSRRSRNGSKSLWYASRSAFFAWP